MRACIALAGVWVVVGEGMGEGGIMGVLEDVYVKCKVVLCYVYCDCVTVFFTALLFSNTCTVYFQVQSRLL